MTAGRVCPHGDRFCPCQDGDVCHYEPFAGTGAAVCPVSGLRPCNVHPSDTGEEGSSPK